MSRIFISHSSVNNAQAIALRDWLVSEGWSELFLDLDPNRGIAAGERWERALNEAARRCEAVLFLISSSWLHSNWCMNELTLARRLNKRLFGVLIEEGLKIFDLPADVTSKWQVVNLSTGSDHKQFPVTLPITGELATPTFSLEGLARLKAGLRRAGLHASYFNWPPSTDPKRAPYRGLRPLEADDAGIFFGREAPIIEAIDRLRGLTEAAAPRLMVILGASGAGKSSFLRAGLLPRLGRDPQWFLPLPVIRPERAAISGETGLVSAITAAFENMNLKVPRGEVRDAVERGSVTLNSLLLRLRANVQLPNAQDGPASKPPTIVFAIDQAEELFIKDAQKEARPLLELLRTLLTSDEIPVVIVFTIRSDNYEWLQTAPELDGVYKVPFDLGPMPKGSYSDVINGPIRRLDGTERAIRLDAVLIDALLTDIEAGGSKDALPLLAFTLERLYQEYGTTGHLTIEQYTKLGRVKGSIEAAVERAFRAADNNAQIPYDREKRFALLRQGFIPWLAGIDLETKAPRRRVAKMSEIPAESRPLIDLLVEQLLLSTDVAKGSGEKTVEPAHEALLRQWSLLQGWLQEDSVQLSTLDSLKRASEEWANNGRGRSWILHNTRRLEAAQSLLLRPDFASSLNNTDMEYLSACANAEEMKPNAEGGKQSQAALMGAGGGALFTFGSLQIYNANWQRPSLPSIDWSLPGTLREIIEVAGRSLLESGASTKVLLPVFSAAVGAFSVWRAFKRVGARNRGKIFICYRRGDAPAIALNIAQRLGMTFGRANVFMDIESLMVGQRFDHQIERSLAQSGVVICIIGSRWLDMLQERSAVGSRDYVRDEVSAALKRKLPVIPVLVDDATLPSADELPDDIRQLVFHQMLTIRNLSFRQDSDSLISAIKLLNRAQMSMFR